MRRNAMPRTAVPLMLLAVVAIAAALVAALAGHDAVDSREEVDRPAREQSMPKPRAREARQLPAEALPSERLPAGPVLDEAEDLAARYALVARNWTPATYRAAWARQIELATDPLRGELETARPDRPEIEALRADDSSSRAKLVRLQRDPRVREPRARVVVVLQERTAAAGQVIEGRTVNDVALRRTRDGWRAQGFTIVPGGA